MTKEEIFKKIKNILVSKFEIKEENITMETHIANDLDLDSIDMVDMIVDLDKELEGLKVNNDDFRSVVTISDIVDKIYEVINRK